MTNSSRSGLKLREDNEMMHFRRILGCKKLFGSKAFAEIEDILNFFRQEKGYFCLSVSRSFCLSPFFCYFVLNLSQQQMLATVAPDRNRK